MTPDECNALQRRLIGKEQAKRSLYYPNEYPRSAERFRIKSVRSPHYVMWRAKTTAKKMEETKRYLNSVYLS